MSKYKNRWLPQMHYCYPMYARSKVIFGYGKKKKKNLQDFLFPQLGIVEFFLKFKLEQYILP